MKGPVKFSSSASSLNIFTALKSSHLFLHFFFGNKATDFILRTAKLVIIEGLPYATDDSKRFASLSLIRSHDNPMG